MIESLQIFEEVINNKILKDIVPIIFFNKVDLFKEKIKEKKHRQLLSRLQRWPKFRGSLQIHL